MIVYEDLDSSYSESVQLYTNTIFNVTHKYPPESIDGLIFTGGDGPVGVQRLYLPCFEYGGRWFLELSPSRTRGYPFKLEMAFFYLRWLSDLTIDTVSGMGLLVMDTLKQSNAFDYSALQVATYQRQPTTRDALFKVWRNSPSLPIVLNNQRFDVTIYTILLNLTFAGKDPLISIDSVSV